MGGLQPGENRLQQVDSLRAVAVFSVLYMHWFFPKLPVGSWGVILFFVISGYLITSSLNRLKASGSTIGRAAQRFFTRRALRLFPAYYVLLLLAATVMPAVRADWLWYGAYLPNVLMALTGEGIPLMRTWSLAVEEQFYVAWFFCVMLLSPRARSRLALVLIVVGVAYRAWDRSGGSCSYLLPASVDALALGSLLCSARGLAPGWASPVAALLVAAACLLKLTLADGQLDPALGPLLIALAATLAVWRARSGFAGATGAVLGWAPVTYLGRISYGIYIYHIATGELFRFAPWVWRLVGSGTPLFLAHVTVTVAIAALSYHFFEQPILRLQSNQRVRRPLLGGAVPAS